MDFSEFYKQKEIDGIKSLVSRSRFMSEETKQFLMDILEKGKDQVMEAAKGKVKEDDEDDDDEDEEGEDDDENGDDEEQEESKKKDVKEGELPPALAKAVAKKKNGNGDDDEEEGDDDDEDKEEPKESKKKTEAKKVTKEEFYDEIRDDMALGSYELKDDNGKVIDEVELTEIYTSAKGKVGKFVRS
tara:strand:- start:4687 stop:5247 length:561 start_codon:yes stop_codon:yes gene_type:complete